MPTPADQVTSLYRARLSTGTAGLLLRIRALWVQQFDPTDPNGSLARIGAVVGTWTTGAQAGAVAETTQYLRALYSAATTIPLAGVEPFQAPPGLVGSAASGSTVMAMAGQAPTVYWARKGSGWSDDLAAASSLAWLNRLASSEPYRVANTTTTTNATGDERFTGRVVRITRANACQFCVTIADRGYIPAHAGFAAHAHCRCTPSPEISSHATSRASVRRGRAAATERPPQPPEPSSGPQPKPEPAPEPASTVNNRAETVPFVGFDKVRAADREEVRSTIALNLEGIRPDIADRLSEVRIADPRNNPLDRRVPNRAMAWYRPAHDNMTIRQSSLRGKADATIARAQTTVNPTTRLTWMVPNAQPRTGLEYVTTHEMGHFMEDQLTAEQKTELRQTINRVAAENLDRQPSGDRFVSPGRQVSGYAVEGGYDELIAEAWAEYKLAPEPRPLAKAIGDAIMGYLG